METLMNTLNVERNVNGGTIVKMSKAINTDN